jgi:WNK lysine deficient protein kinase
MENNFRDSLDFKEQQNDNNNNNNNNYSSKITKENLETKISLLSLEGGTENESSMDMERKVVEESPKGRFQRFEEELGSGSQKKVYLAYDTDTGREVAWNAVIVNITDENSIKKIKAEIEILKPLKHPNIISFIFCFFNDTKNEIVFITELFSGGSLSKYLLEFKYPRLRLVKLWCQEILKGLKYLHEYKPPIIHRDIKCDNIFINKNTGEVKIGDLGLSIILKDTEYAEQFCGTIEYCSPEVYQKKYGVKCDIYSFGMSMIEMITGEKPYSECKGQIMVVCNKVKNRILPICMNKIKNEKVIEFIKKCLKPEEERPSADELLNDKFLNDLDSEENNFPAINNPELQNKYSNRSLLLSIRDIKNKNIEEPLEDSSSIDIKSNITYNNQNHNYNMKMNKNNDLNNSKKSKNVSNEIELNNNEKNNNFIQELINNLNIKDDKENIKQNENSIKGDNDINTNKNEIKDNETEISFVIDEDEKSDLEICKIILLKKNGNKTSKFKFNYIFTVDTIQGVVNELTKVVNLTNNEIKQCENKLKIFIREIKNKIKEKQDIDEQINIINNCYELFTKEYNDNLAKIQEIKQLYQEIKDNSIDYTKEEIQDIDNKMKILEQLK